MNRLRRLVVRLAGFAVAALVAVVAIQWLLLGFETDPLFDESLVRDIVDGVRSRPRVGVGVLGGVALIGVGLWIAWGLIAARITDRPVITTRPAPGWTKVDRPTLAASLQRRLTEVDGRADVAVTVGRKGKVDLRVVTPDADATGSLREIRDAVEDITAARSLPIRPGRLVATTPRRPPARRRVE